MIKTGSFIKYGDTVFKYSITDEEKDLIIDKLIAYYAKNCHTGESIMQDDDSQIEAPLVLGEIVDEIIKFTETENE